MALLRRANRLRRCGKGSVAPLLYVLRQPFNQQRCVQRQRRRNFGGNFRRPVGEGRSGKARMKRVGDQAAAGGGPALDHHRLQAGARQHCGGGEAVRASTNDRCVVSQGQFRSPEGKRIKHAKRAETRCFRPWLI